MLRPGRHDLHRPPPSPRLEVLSAYVPAAQSTVLTSRIRAVLVNDLDLVVVVVPLEVSASALALQCPALIYHMLLQVSAGFGETNRTLDQVRGHVFVVRCPRLTPLVASCHSTARDCAESMGTR
eukprot:1790102-Rhodomonas_salina.20